MLDEGVVRKAYWQPTEQSGQCLREDNVKMVAALVLVISMAALSQFAMSYWRSILTGASAHTISDEVLDAAGIEKRPLSGEDFGELIRLHSHASSDSSGVGFVGFYYGAVRAAASLAGHRASSIADWAEREMSLCSQYVGVLIDQRLQANLDLQ
jgi:hypothetical protein